MSFEQGESGGGGDGDDNDSSGSDSDHEGQRGQPAGRGRPRTLGRTSGKEIRIREPRDFNGKPENLRNFLQQCTLYLQLNKHVYKTDEQKIGFILSCMTEGAAATWAETYLNEYLEQDAFVFPPFGIFLNHLANSFKDVAAGTDAIFKLEKIRQEGKPLEEHNVKFENYLTRAGIFRPKENADLLLNRYLQSLDDGLRRRVLQAKPPIVTLRDAMAVALEENLQYRKAT